MVELIARLTDNEYFTYFLLLSLFLFLFLEQNRSGKQHACIISFNTHLSHTAVPA